ncbi:MAG: ATP-binding protein [Neisseria sp.]|uniref:AAA family ATPase n=1 Tax=Neisseria sp. TaxID=192066 RepID=UPI0026DADB78|nr:ATP-binding protein [Neisseria sp.]MDO4640079.1 ATP-binding protein [Neisseria sp.]
MKFHFENLGLLDKAELELSDLTIICGENNTGKTYATYAIYGFLRNWKNLLRKVIYLEIRQLEHPKEKYQIDLEKMFKGKINTYLNKMSEEFIGYLPEVFASKEGAFSKTIINVNIDTESPISRKPFKSNIQGGGKILTTITKEENSTILEILTTDDKMHLVSFDSFVIEAIIDIVFSPYFPNTHISSAERTGAAIFRKELDMARTRILKALNEMDAKDIKRIKSMPWELLDKVDTDYAWPVEDNVEFVRQLEDIDKQTSELSKQNPEILPSFYTIIGGTYKVVRNQGLFFQAKKGKQKFTMNEASSCARALLDVGFYLRCRAKVGDLFIIDEPELNLHPKNQRAFARLISRLVNSGVKVFMTTHSDYLVKELNTLIMLNQKTKHTKNVQEKYEYVDEEILNPELVKLYITTKGGPRKQLNVLQQATIHSNFGIEVSTFDDTIELMNEIQSNLVYGG